MSRLVDVLVSVEKVAWLRPVDVFQERTKSLMNFAVAFVDSLWGIVRYKYVNGRKLSKCIPHLMLLEEMMPAGFVFPTSSKSPERQATILSRLEMEVGHTRSEWRSGIVISAHGEHALCTVGIGRSINGRIPEITK